jgi:hypothetical protein
MFPSIKTLENAFPGKGKEIRQALTGDLDSILEKYPKVQEWHNRCHHAPMLHELRMAACDEILCGYGVEYEKGIGSFVNMGDPYVTTIIQRYAGHYVVKCYGDIAEKARR